jgi:hypothetical protein
VVALLCAAAGSAAPPSVKSVAAARERAAGRKAVELLDRIALPAGARATRTSPAALHRGELGTSVITMFAYRHRFWKMRESVDAVTSFVQQHRLAGYRNDGGCGAACLSFYPQSTHGPMRGMYAVSLVRQRGWTFVRVDAASAWIYPRSPHEKLPAGIREVDVSGGGVTRNVVDAKKVARIVRWFGRLSVVPPGVTVSCQVVVSARVTFSFRSAGRAVVARAVAPAGGADGCDPVSFTIGRRAQTPLADTTAVPFARRVEHLLGVCFGAGPGRGRSSPSCNRQWAKEEAAKLLHQFRLPSGARVLAKEPRGDGGLLRSPETIPGGAELVDQHRIWKVHVSLAAAEAFVEHEHHARKTGSGNLDGPGVPPNRSVTFTYDPRNGIIASRALEVTFVTLPHGWTGVRADAQVTWIYPRTLFAPPARTGDAIVVQAGSTTRRITSYARLQRITFRFDRLQIVQPGTTFHCGPTRLRGPKVTIEFHGVNPKVTGRAVAGGTGFSTACDPIRFSVHGHKALLVGGDFVRWLEGVLRVRFRAAAPSVKEIAAARKHAAAVAARKLLREFVPPPGARLIRGRPHDYGRFQGIGAPGGEYVDVHHFWIGHADLASVLAFEKAHAPSGFSVGGGSTNANGTHTVLTFDSPQHGFATRRLAIAISQRKTRTIVEADAQVVWVYPRSPQEVVPAGVREIDVKAPHVSRTVTNPAQIAKIVRSFDRLPITPPGVAAMCGAFLSTNVTLVFRSATGAAVATARVPAPRASICDTIDFTIHGKSQVPLIDNYRGESFAYRLQHLLGVRLR